RRHGKRTRAGRSRRPRRWRSSIQASCPTGPPTGPCRSTAVTAAWTSMRSLASTVTRRFSRSGKGRMRCSAWSSRSIWVCSLALAALLLHAAGARAAEPRFQIDPASIAPGAHVELTVSVPNVGNRKGVNHVTIGIPQDFQLDAAEAKTGWKQSRTGQAVTWWGGSIPVGEFVRFGVRGTAPSSPETVLFNVVVGDRSGKSATYKVPLEVAAPSTHASSRPLARTALVVAICGTVLGLVAVALGVANRRRGSPP